MIVLQHNVLCVSYMYVNAILYSAEGLHLHLVLSLSLQRNQFLKVLLSQIDLESDQGTAGMVWTDPMVLKKHGSVVNLTRKPLMKKHTNGVLRTCRNNTSICSHFVISIFMHDNIQVGLTSVI